MLSIYSPVSCYVNIWISQELRVKTFFNFLLVLGRHLLSLKSDVQDTVTFVRAMCEEMLNSRKTSCYFPTSATSDPLMKCQSNLSHNFPPPYVEEIVAHVLMQTILNDGWAEWRKESILKLTCIIRVCILFYARLN